MLSGESIVCFAPDLWGDIWRNRHRLLSIFARTNRVVYVEPRTHARGLSRKLGESGLSVLSPFSRRVEAVRENLFVYHDPGFLPRTTRRGIGTAIDWLRDVSLRRALRKLEVERPILWLVRPDTWDVPGKLREKLLFYQVVDDYLSYPGVTDRARSRLDREERLIASKADFVVVTADHLLQAKSHLHSALLQVRNGVDDRTLQEGKLSSGPIPAELAAAKRPVWGYIGGITEKLDLELLEKLAQRLEQRGGTLAMVGPVKVAGEASAQAIRRLRASAAVIFAGQRPAEEVPMWLRGFNVGLIPYKIGDQARAIDPLKLYEYLAFGMPVVAVDIPGLRPFRDFVSVASCEGDFLRLADEAALDRDEARVSARRALAAENSWERRAEQLSQAMEAGLRRRAKG